MNHSPTVAASPRSIYQPGLADYLELTKPGITLLVTFTTASGYYLAHGPIDSLQFLHTVLGTSFTAAGAATLNQYRERAVDARMPRTARRPLPAGHVNPRAALLFGFAVATVGLLQLLLLARPIAALIALVALLAYVCVYTPLKRRTGLCTLVGTLPGALPILAGYAVRGGLRDIGGWLLFLMLVFWQLPHFAALAWLFREQYHNAGLRIMSVGENGARAVARTASAGSGLLLVTSLLPLAFREAGVTYAVAAALLGMLLLRLSLRMRVAESRSETARQLFALSLVYLPTVLVVMMLERLV